MTRPTRRPSPKTSWPAKPRHGRAGLLPQIQRQRRAPECAAEREYTLRKPVGLRDVIEPLSYFSTSRTVQVRQSVFEYGEHRQLPARPRPC